MKFLVNGNYLGSEIFKSKKSGEDYKIVKVLVEDEKYQCFTDLELKTDIFDRLENVKIYFELLPYNNNFNLNILSIEKVNNGK